MVDTQFSFSSMPTASEETDTAGVERRMNSLILNKDDQTYFNLQSKNQGSLYGRLYSPHVC